MKIATGPLIASRFVYHTSTVGESTCRRRRYVLHCRNKMRDEEFPRADIEALGLHAHSGQRTYNGVAILSRCHR